MSARRVDMHRLQEFVRYHRLGKGSREIARLLKMSRNTMREYSECLGAAGLLDGSPEEIPELEVLQAAIQQHRPPCLPPQQCSSIEAWRESISQMLERGAGPKAIYDKLRLDDKDFKASLSAVKRLCARLRQEKGIQPEDVAVPVLTDPGEVAQVDFGFAGRLYDPETRTMRRAWVFVLVLCYSRHMFCRIVFDQSAETWQQLHIEAFRALGGVPATVVPDNLKAAVIRASFAVDEPSQLNRSYRELARHYGITIDPTPVRQPQKKGKVESAVKYVARNFFKPRTFQNIQDANAQLDRWVREIASQRIHGTTGERPFQVFDLVERHALKPLPERRYEVTTWKQTLVHRDCHVLFARRFYSVPWQLVGQEVWVRATSSTVAVYYDDRRVATHDRNAPGHRSTIESHLPEHRVEFRHRSPAYWLERADELGPVVGRYIREVFASDEVASKLKTAQSIVLHLEGVPRHRAAAACERASYYGAYSFQAVRRILSHGLDLEPTFETFAAAVPDEPQPRFARNFADIIPIKGGHS